MKTQSNMGRTNTSSSKCCSTPWLLYLLVIIALVLSGLNFWMNLYRHEQLRSEVRDLETRINATKEKVQNPQFVEMYLKENHNFEFINKDSKELNGKGANMRARLIYDDDYKAQVDNLTREISMALKQEIGENTNNHSNHLKKKVNSLKKKVDEYYEETEIIRSSYQKQNQILNQLQEKILAFDETKEKIFKSSKRLHDQMKRLQNQVNTTSTTTGANYGALKNLENDLSGVKNSFNKFKENIGARKNNAETLGFDVKVFGEWQSLTDQKISDLRNELGNTTDNIMDKMFEKDNNVGKKMKEYDNKILNIRNEYNGAEEKILSLDQDLKEAMTKTEDQMNKVYGEMIQINETLSSEISKIAEKKANGIALSSYNDYDLGEYSRLSSLLKIYAKKDAIEDVMAGIEEIRSSVKSLSDQKNRLEVVGNRNTYSNDRFNETLQDMKQKLDYMERGIAGNGNELFTISNWKNQVGTKLENLTYNITRTETKLDETADKLTITEHKTKRYGTKLARLSKSIQKLHKLAVEIESLKSQITILEKVK